MSTVDLPPGTRLPTHLDLPDSDGENVINGFERAQTNLILEPLRRYLMQSIHTDGNFFLGGDMGFYWRITNPPLDGCKCPDIAYVPNVPPMLDGTYRHSYVMWQEQVSPQLLIELVSDGDGREERDTTPNTGKFWVYEQGIRTQYYGIFDPDREHLELFELIAGRFRPVARNHRDRFPLPLIGLELGVWEGEFQQVRSPFVRLFTQSGFMLETPEEAEAAAAEQLEEAEKQNRQQRQKARAEAKKAEQERLRADAEAKKVEQEKERAEQFRQQAEQERQRADEAMRARDLLLEKLRQLGVDPDSL